MDERAMPHEIARLMLEQANTFLDREEAIRTALSVGMPLGEIEAYLDWLDLMRSENGEPSREEDDRKEGHE